ncbi:LysR family transcriptional regulator [Rhodobacter capsulatus]|uniref:LysR family transcriptional regulator n=1 Tax=Rhodobacter capsulatus TaxID=1061 RepID=UPI004038B7D0
MKTPRRFLPSLSLLQAFETAARTQSITAAAAELSLTQSAVSRQIRALEAQLGTELFHRERQTIRLTQGGAAYAREIRAALQKISTASLTLRANPGGGTLTLAILPTFGTRWLAPRLPDFLAAHPGITLNLVTRLTQFDFATEAVDAAIHFGVPDWPGAECTWLRGEHVVPACSPDLAARHGFATLQELRAAPLLHLTSRPDAWKSSSTARGWRRSSCTGCCSTSSPPWRRRRWWGWASRFARVPDRGRDRLGAACGAARGADALGRGLLSVRPARAGAASAAGGVPRLAVRRRAGGRGGRSRPARGLKDIFTQRLLVLCPGPCFQIGRCPSSASPPCPSCASTSVTSPFLRSCC